MVTVAGVVGSEISNYDSVGINSLSALVCKLVFDAWLLSCALEVRRL